MMHRVLPASRGPSNGSKGTKRGWGDETAAAAAAGATDTADEQERTERRMTRGAFAAQLEEDEIEILAVEDGAGGGEGEGEGDDHSDDDARYMANWEAEREKKTINVHPRRMNLSSTKDSGAGVTVCPLCNFVAANDCSDCRTVRCIASSCDSLSTFCARCWQPFYSDRLDKSVTRVEQFLQDPASMRESGLPRLDRLLLASHRSNPEGVNGLEMCQEVVRMKHEGRSGDAQ